MEKFRVVKEIPEKEYLTGRVLVLITKFIRNNFGVSIETDYELHYDDDLYANHVLRLPQHPLEYNGVFEAVKEEVKKEHTDQDMIEFANYCAYKIGENRLGGKSTWKELLDEYKKQKTT